MPHSRSLVISPSRSLFVIAMLLVFVGSFSALKMIGLNVYDVEGGLLKRLHPSFYLALPFLWLRVLKPGRSRWESSASSFHPVKGHSELRAAFLFHGTVVAIAIALLLLGITHASLAPTASTFLLPLLCIAGVRHLSPNDLRFLRGAILLFLLSNSLLGILEKHLEFRAFTYTAGIQEKLNDPRPTAWLSHPLNNAVITALVLVYLLYAPAARRLGAWRIPMIGVHAYALISFGGRTAVVSLFGVVTLDYVLALLRSAVSDKGTKRLLAKTVAVMVGITVAAVFLFLGLFDDLLARFMDDGGSAEVRWGTFDMIRDIRLRSALLGFDMSWIEYTAYSNSLPTIEFSWLFIVLSHGLIVGGILLVSLCRLLVRVSVAFGRTATYMIVLFTVVTFGYTSIASASLLLSQLALMLAAFLETNFVACRK